MAVAREWLNKHASTATDMHTTIEELLQAVFPMRSMQRPYKETNFIFKMDEL
jgi:hypothetical protein